MKNLGIFLGSLVLTCLLSLSVAADQTQTNYAIGQVGASELQIGLGPRPVAMGEAFVAEADDLNSTAWNPAGLSQIQGLQAGFMHDIYLENTSLEYLAYAQNLFPGGGLGANVAYVNYGSMDKVDDSANVVSNFTPSVFMASVGYGQWLFSSLAVGGAVKVYNQNIDTYKATAVAVDLGAIVKPTDTLKFGLAIQNIGSKVSDSNLPTNAKVGLAYVVPVKISASDTWNFVADVNVPFGDTSYTSGNIGTEYWFSNFLAARVGYAITNTGDLGGVTGLTAGAGIKLPVSDTLVLNVDYAMLSFGDLGLTNQIALSVAFK